MSDASVAGLVSDPVPRVLGPYHVLARVAVGGSSEIYKAVNRGTAGFEKPVALKVLREELAEDDDTIARFHQEARLLSSLKHGHIVAVHQLGLLGARPYMVLEWIDGCHLGALMAQSALPVGVVLRVLRDVLEALSYAHARSILHRDLSPDNVIVSREGVVKIADFGTAKPQDSEVRTRAGVLHGKFAYLSPEQAAGWAIDPRADLFSLALIAFEALEGRPAYGGESEGAVLAAARAGRVPPLDRGDLSHELRAVLARALAREPEARFVSARDFIVALDAVPERAADMAALARYVCGAKTMRTETPQDAKTIVASAATRVTAMPQPRPRMRTKQLVAIAAGVVGCFALAYALRSAPPEITVAPVAVEAEDIVPAPQQPEPAKKAYVSLNARPWAYVTIDGKRLPGRTPHRRLEIEPGQHQVTFETSLGHRREIRFDALPGEEVRHVVDFLDEGAPP